MENMQNDAYGKHKSKIHPLYTPGRSSYGIIETLEIPKRKTKY